MDHRHNVSTPIEGLTGIELERSFLMGLQEWRHQLDYLHDSNVQEWSDEEVEMFVRNLGVLDANLEQMYSKIESGEHRHAGD